MRKALVACETFGKVRDELIKRGWDAISCDLRPTKRPGPHYQGDVRDILHVEDWDLIIAHPPCTYITNTGVCHLHKDADRWFHLDDACDFFRMFLNHPCKRIAIENPIPHCYALERIGRKYDQLIQPWMFGHPETKATCLWLKGLPSLSETNNVRLEMSARPAKERMRLHYLPQSPDRAELRSETYDGIAQAMAAQWVAFIDQQDLL